MSGADKEKLPINSESQSKVFDLDDTFTCLMDISEIIRVKKLSIHPHSFWLGVQSIDPFQGFYIADLPKISLGRCDTYIMSLLLFVGE